MRTSKLVAVMTILLFLVGCSSFIKNSYVSMSATGVTYNTVMTGVSSAQKLGKVTEEQRVEINKAGLAFASLWPVVVDGLKTYKTNPSEGTQEAIIMAIQTLLDNWMTLANIINIYLPGQVPVSASNAVLLKGKTASGQKFTVSIKKLDSGQVSIIIEIAGAVLSYLIPAIQSFINDIGKVDITLEDLEALKTLIKAPDQY